MINGNARKKVEELDAEIEALMKVARGEVPEDDQKQVEESAEEPKPKEPVEVAKEEEVLSKEEATYKKRFGDLRRHSQKKEDEYKAKIAELEGKVNSSRSTTELPTDPQKVSEWVKKYPEVASIIVSLSKDANKATYENFQSRMEELENTRLEIEKEKAEAKIRKAHPDFDDIISDDNFHAWVEKSPSHIQEKVYENDDPEDVIWVLGIYKNISAKTEVVSAAKDSLIKSKTASPTTEKSGKKWRESDVQKLTVKEYEKHEDSIVEAMRSGNFEYDISGGAR